MSPFYQNIPRCNIKSYQASQSWLAPDNLNQLCKAQVVKLLRIFLPKSFAQIHTCTPDRPHSRQTSGMAGSRSNFSWKVWTLTSGFVAPGWLIIAINADTSHWDKDGLKRNVTQPCPQTVHQNGVLQFKWTDSCGPLWCEREAADTCWVVKVSGPDWRAFVLLSRGCSQPLSPVVFIISISIFKGVDAGQRWRPF